MDLDRQLLRTLIDRRVRELTADDPETCSGCGADYDARTAGCKKCNDRHRSRIRRTVRECAQCGCRYQERTTGCHTCTERHRYRRKRDRRVA